MVRIHHPPPLFFQEEIPILHRKTGSLISNEDFQTCGFQRLGAIVRFVVSTRRRRTESVQSRTSQNIPGILDAAGRRFCYSGRMNNTSDTKRLADAVETFAATVTD